MMLSFNDSALKCMVFTVFFTTVFYSSLSKAEPNPPSIQSSVFFELSALTDADYDWIGARIYQNEAASKAKYLTHWGKGEDFPSFGIAHFIWFPKDVNPPFEETFPTMVQFVSQFKKPPIWLQQLQANPNSFKAPWNNKTQFDQLSDSEALQQLRTWLLATQSQQARFIALSFEQRWLAAIAPLSVEKQVLLNQRLKEMMAFKQGLFAVIDYFNFKGIGHNSKEQYQGQSWGLISVLESMPVLKEPSEEQLLEAFIQASKDRLRLRTQLAPTERNEARWLKGWFKRLDAYAQIP